MNADNSEVARNLFSIMTVVLEKAAAAAVDGQAPKLSVRTCRAVGIYLEQTARDLDVLSKTALMLARSD